MAPASTTLVGDILSPYISVTPTRPTANWVTLTLGYSTSTSVTAINIAQPPQSTSVGSQTDHSRLTPGQIGAIVGSILGVIIIAIILWFCCFRPGSDPYSPPSSPSPHRSHRGGLGRGSQNKKPAERRTTVGKTPDGGIVFKRPAMKRRSDDHVPIYKSRRSQTRRGQDLRESWEEDRPRRGQG